MRAILAVASLLLALVVVTPSAAAESECRRGPYEIMLPVNVDCCGWHVGSFCFAECKVFVYNPVKDEIADVTGGLGAVDVCLEQELASG